MGSGPERWKLATRRIAASSTQLVPVQSPAATAATAGMGHPRPAAVVCRERPDSCLHQAPPAQAPSAAAPVFFTCWNLRSSPGSFSIVFLNLSGLLQPKQRSWPRARAGLRIAEPSNIEAPCTAQHDTAWHVRSGHNKPHGVCHHLTPLTNGQRVQKVAIEVQQT